MLEVLTQRELLRKNVSFQVLGCRERLVFFLESMALKLQESCFLNCHIKKLRIKACLTVNGS